MKKLTIRQSPVFFGGSIVALITRFLRDWNAAAMQTRQFLSLPFHNAPPHSLMTIFTGKMSTSSLTVLTRRSFRLPHASRCVPELA